MPKPRHRDPATARGSSRTHEPCELGTSSRAPRPPARPSWSCTKMGPQRGHALHWGQSVAGTRPAEGVGGHVWSWFCQAGLASKGIWEDVGPRAQGS